MNYLSNAFSLGMLPEGASPVVETVTERDIRLECTDCSGGSRFAHYDIHGKVYNDQAGHKFLTCHSVVGHSDVATILSNLLGCPVAFNRETVSLSVGDIVFVAQYVGNRLPEGTTVLPDGAEIKWLRVTVVDDVKGKLERLRKLPRDVEEQIKQLDKIAVAYEQGDSLTELCVEFWGECE